MSYANIIGRNKEIQILERIYKSKKSELVAIYGRRRVGKSYLVSECFGKKILFKAVGTYVKDGDKDYETYRQTELSKAIGVKTGGSLTKLLDNLRESGINT